MMKKRMKALLAIGLSAIIMVCSAGCGNGKEHMKAETDPDIPVEDVSFPLKEKAELSFITSAPATSTQEPNERTIFKRLEKQTNVHIDWTCFVSDQFDDKKNLALAQFGNLPDGLFNAGMSDYDLLRYAKQGIIIPVENLIDKYMPNLKAVFEKYPEYRTMCTAPDGHIYSFPWIEQLGAGKEAIQAIGDIPYINKKWLDYLKLDVPTTTEELEQVLVAFRDNADKLEKKFNIEGGVIPMSFIINTHKYIRIHIFTVHILKICFMHIVETPFCICRLCYIYIVILVKYCQRSVYRLCFTNLYRRCISQIHMFQHLTTFCILGHLKDIK